MQGGGFAPRFGFAASGAGQGQHNALGPELELVGDEQQQESSR